MAEVRKLGISGENRETQTSTQIQPSVFDQAGLVGRFRRQYAVTFEITKQLLSEASVIFGEELAAFFGRDSIDGFFKNSDGGRLFVKSHQGNDGVVVDAVVSSATIIDGSSADTLKQEFAYKEELSFGVVGDSTARQITNGARYTTAAAATAIPAATSIQLDAIGGAKGVKVGDIIEVNLTGGDTKTVFHKILTVDESAQTVTFTGPLNTTSETLLIGDEINVIGFRIQMFLKNSKGVVTEVEKDLGLVFCTMEPEVADFFVENVHKENRFSKWTDQGSASVLNLSFPVDDSAPVFMTGGSDGTSPTVLAHHKFNHAAFDNDPIRMWTNSDTTLKAVFDEMEVYIKGRSKTDFPEVIVNTQGNLTKAALIALGRSHQTSDGEGSFKIIVGSRVEKPDQFNNSPIAPPRQIPSVGHQMGAWVRAIRVLGIHEVPAVPQIVLRGLSGVVENQKFSDDDRTDLAEAGINIIQQTSGGIRIRNWFTPSNLPEFAHGNAQVMRNLIRESIKEAITPNENEPNVFSNVKSMKDSMQAFMFNLHRQGSNQRVPEGETFGQLFDEATGEAQAVEELFEVIVDPSNNPNAQLKLGNRNGDILFQRPTPTGSIIIAVGLIF